MYVMYVCMCAHICMYVCMYVCTYVFMYVLQGWGTDVGIYMSTRDVHEAIPVRVFD